MMQDHWRINGYHFSSRVVDGIEARNASILDSAGDERAMVQVRALFLDVPPVCNFRCPYCYTKSEPNASRIEGLSASEMLDVIQVAAAHGAESVVLAGDGEPMLSRHFWFIIESTAREHMKCVVFTNGSRIGRSEAAELRSSPVSIILKVNSLNPSLQDDLVGVRGAHQLIYSALENLLSVGFRAPRLAVQSAIMKPNMLDLRRLFLFCRRNRIVPYFETYVAMGRGATPFVRRELEPTAREVRAFFTETQALDREVFGIDWDIYPGQRVIAYGPCNKSHVAITVSPNGDVFRCVTESIPLGNIRRTALEEILASPRTIAALVKRGCSGCKSVTM